MSTAADKTSNSPVVSHSKNHASGQPTINDATGNRLTSRRDLGLAVSELDEQMKVLLKNAVDQLTPGSAFDASLIKQISKIETKKIRLITSRLEMLIRKGHPDISDIVERVLKIPV